MLVEAQLRDAGLRVTGARAAVLVAMESLQARASHAEVAAALNGPLDRVTLYRTLDALVDAGLAKRQIGDDRVGRFSLTAGAPHDDHAHFHCADCGRVYCLSLPVPNLTQMPAGFAVQTIDFKLSGQCGDCAAAS
ncbi:MAG: transcriptional repressor [Rubrivivax sp.]|nr:transcriptional repressor [Rubrivivax sp.]